MKEIVFEGRDNSVDLLLKSATRYDPELKVTDLTDITRMVLEREDGFAVDSEQESNIFDWATLATSGIVVIQLGHINLKNTEDKWRLVVFDATNDKGIVWGDKDFKIRINAKYAAHT
jgi:hypothetical protein